MESNEYVLVSLTQGFFSIFSLCMSLKSWKIKRNESFLAAKVSKSQKQILKFSFEPKTEQKYFCIFALASKMGQIKKMIVHYHAN